MREPHQFPVGPRRQGSSQNFVLAVFTEEHVHFKKYQSSLSSLVFQRNSKGAGGVENRASEQKGPAVTAQAQEGGGRGCARAPCGGLVS